MRTSLWLRLTGWRWQDWRRFKRAYHYYRYNTVRYTCWEALCALAGEDSLPKAVSEGAAQARHPRLGRR